jgi:anti-sigma B factor antagonist
MDVHEHTFHGVPVVELSGRLTLESFGQLKDRMSPIIDAGASQLVLDLGAVSYVDSIGVAELVRSHVMFANRGGRLVLASVPDHLTRLLRLTKLDQIVGSCGSRDDAVHALRDAKVKRV